MKALKEAMETVARLRTRVESAWSARPTPSHAADLSLSEAASRFPSRNELHRYMHAYFSNRAPRAVRDHRNYFACEGRGFGENALHSMWYLLQREYRPRRCLEIGVFRGQTISLWALNAKLLGYEVEVCGLSPFSDLGDAVSTYSDRINYYDDTLANFAAFELPKPSLVRAASNSELGKATIGEGGWDLIYIDGCHDYEVAATDYVSSLAALTDGGLLVLDDSSIGTSFRPPRYSFAGHPGPSRVRAELAEVDMDLVAGIGHNNIFRKRPPQKR